MRPRVKICGIRNILDAKNALKFGADAIGLLVGQKHNAVDFISTKEAKEIIDKLPPFCSSVLVTHMAKAKEIYSIASYVGASNIQLHGDSSVEDVLELKSYLPHVKLIKCLHVVDEGSIDGGQEFFGLVDAILLDTINVDTNQVGGTGLVHDWSISRKIVEACPLPVILAGGLRSDNVQEAVQKVNPFAVDVNSGTKGKNGHKDLLKLQAFIENAKA